VILRRIVAGASLLVLILVVGWNAAAAPGAAEVRPGGSVERAIARGDRTVRLLAGSHGPFTITRPGTTVVGTPGAEVRGPVVVDADDVVLRDLRVRGGESGISVLGAEDAVLDGVRVEGAELHGIEVVNAHATIRDCAVGGLGSRYAQGIEIRNSSTRPRSVVIGCRIDGGQEGLLTHSSRVEFLDNLVTGTTMRGVAITEMSEGVMEGNLVRSALGNGLYCGDMSHCEIRHNTVRDLAPVPGGPRALAGYGAVAWYHSTVRLRGNVLDVAPTRRVRIGSGSVITDRFPPSVWAPGWPGVVPAIWVGGLALGGLASVRLAVEPWNRRVRRRRAQTLAARTGPDPTTVLLAGFAVQSFHMLEHLVQVVQVYVFDGEQRSGLAGAVIDTEWVHFVYNVAVMAFMVWAWRRLRPEIDRLPARIARWWPWFVAGTLIQGYHLMEHTAKLVQHLAIGVDPAPGLIGGRLGLVWFHFGINLAVYAGLALLIVGRSLHNRRLQAAA